MADPSLPAEHLADSGFKPTSEGYQSSEFFSLQRPLPDGPGQGLRDLSSHRGMRPFPSGRPSLLWVGLTLGNDVKQEN